MKSPFPGMDPYLEQHWGSAHNALVVYICDVLNTGLLQADLRADLRRRSVMFDPEFDAALSGPSEQTSEFSAHITDMPGTEVVTVIELTTNAIKLPGKHHDEYVKMRNDYLARGANVVEIDLCRSGLSTISPRFANMFDFRVSCLIAVFRARGPGDEVEIYPVEIRKPIPEFRMPLRASDKDVTLHLQALMDRAYTNGRYSIDYNREPVPPFHPSEATWADRLLRNAGLSK